MITLVTIFYIYLAVMGKLGYPYYVSDYIMASLLTFLTFMHVWDYMSAYKVSKELAKQLGGNQLNANQSSKEEYFDKIT